MTYQPADRFRVGDRARHAPVGDEMTGDGSGWSAGDFAADDEVDGLAGVVDPDPPPTDDPSLAGIFEK
jgi:hypothetical protein